MIETFSAYIKTIVVFLIFSVFAEIIIPDSHFRKYIGLILGFLMIVTLLSPILKLVNGFDPETLLWAEKNTTTSLERSFDKELLEGQKENQMVTEIYKEELQDRMKKNLEENGISVSSVKVEVEERADSENYGEIINIKASFTQETQKRQGIISVEPVRVFDKEGQREEKNENEIQTQMERKAVSVLEENFGVAPEQVEIQR